MYVCWKLKWWASVHKFVPNGISHLVNLFDDCWLDFFMTCFEVGVISFVVRDRGLELESSDTSHIVNKDKWYTF